MTDAEISKAIVKLANEIEEYSEKTHQPLETIIYSLNTDFHPEFTEPIGELVYEILGWDCNTEYVDEIYTPKFKEIMRRIASLFEMEYVCDWE